MPTLRNFEREGDSVRYSVYDDDGHFVRGSHYDARHAPPDGADLVEEARSKRVALKRLVEQREAAIFGHELEITILPPLPEVTAVKDHTHEEFSYPLSEHDHPHEHKLDVAPLNRRLEEQAGQIEELLKLVGELSRQLMGHEHPKPPEHTHPLMAHDHSLVQHEHPFPEHAHPPLDHQHPLLVHEHPLVEHQHPPHDHPLPGHEHQVKDHDHAVVEHSHELKQHDHPHNHALPEHEHKVGEHEHQTAEHEHPPHIHPEIAGVFEKRPDFAEATGIHLHRFDTVLDDNKGIRCGICGVPRSEVSLG